MNGRHEVATGESGGRQDLASGAQARRLAAVVDLMLARQSPQCQMATARTGCPEPAGRRTPAGRTGAPQKWCPAAGGPREGRPARRLARTTSDLVDRLTEQTPAPAERPTTSDPAVTENVTIPVAESASPTDPSPTRWEPPAEQSPRTAVTKKVTENVTPRRGAPKSTGRPRPNRPDPLDLDTGATRTRHGARCLADARRRARAADPGRLPRTGILGRPPQQTLDRAHTGPPSLAAALVHLVDNYQRAAGA